MQDLLDRPSYEKATQSQIKLICNGCGAEWMPNWFRVLLTKASQWFFDEASWNHHDFGYYIGFTEKHRLEYDNKFLAAMLRDSKNQVFYKMYYAYVLSFLFYILVRLFGWLSFNYSNTYQKLPE